MSECAKMEMSYTEQDYDLDPVKMIEYTGLPRSSYSQHRGSETFSPDSPDRPARRHCDICGGGPVGALSDYGYADFTDLDEWDRTDDDQRRRVDTAVYSPTDSGNMQPEPEIVTVCFGCARQMLYDETDVPDPLTGLRASDGIEREAGWFQKEKEARLAKRGR